MSLNYLGISHSPVLRRQFSSPPTAAAATIATAASAASSKETTPDQENVTQDSKDVLIERLNDLALRLAEDRLEDAAVSVLHKEVDRIELLMRARGGDARPAAPGRLGSQNGQSSGSKNGDEDVFWGPATPTRNVRMGIPQSLQQPKLNEDMVAPAPRITASRATELATSAEALVSQLTEAVSEIQARRDESIHIHDLLVDRCERAAARILFLEDHISSTEEDFEACQSEMKYLRLQLRALEAQCLPYLKTDQDRELSDSIRNWRLDWEDIDRRTKARRKKCRIKYSLDCSDGSPSKLDSSSS
ncbi:hypothetical protein PVAG01_06598 [Phlyctema vagabunda]|uniref:Uncharacterized protein n=1 Tax=Phlyctema vagabunda TaxID=108571 RepID=A0ABR4PGI4_9HELO